jgi:hypothetical protein
MMSAKILYSKAGSDPSTITWPLAGQACDRFTFTSGTPTIVRDLIVYDSTTLTYADGRSFPVLTSAGSTFVHQK